MASDFVEYLLDLLRLGVLGAGLLEPPFLLVIVLHFHEDQILAAEVNLQALHIAGLEACQLRIAQGVERNGDVVELVGLDLEELIVIGELGEAVFLRDDLRRHRRLAELRLLRLRHDPRLRVRYFTYL